MNDKQFMGLGIRIVGGGYTNCARQSIRGAPDSMVEDAKYALLYQLLKIFLTQRLDAYLDYHAANSTLLKSYGKHCL